MTLTAIFLIAWSFNALVMLLLWMMQYKTENAGIVDVAWSFLTPLVGAWLIVMDNVDNGNRQWLIIGLALFWGFRLGAFLYNRVMNEVEDGRYRYMREHCGRYAQVVMLVFFQVQATYETL